MQNRLKPYFQGRLAHANGILWLIDNPYCELGKYDPNISQEARDWYDGYLDEMFEEPFDFGFFTKLGCLIDQFIFWLTE